MHDKLLASPSIRSLAAEQRLANLIHSLGWDVTHGSFYVDPQTAKVREMDVVARACWWKTRQHSDQMAAVELFCEVKSARDYHLVFAPTTGGSYPPSPRWEWLGHHDTSYAALLGRTGVTPEAVQTLMHSFTRYSVTRDELIIVHALIPRPPVAPITASAFRETNVGGERELEASVLWKAVQAVLASVEASRREFVDRIFDDALVVAEAARYGKRDVITELDLNMQHELNLVEIYHPFVVVESTLWSFVNNSLSEIPWCRFYQVSNTADESWCDVVSMAAAADYIQHLTNHYQMFMRRLRAKNHAA